ncbi:MAG: MFS transporter [Anaerolineales bacterium]|nr:MFS transporter [Anaerolineales bacterium]
MSSSRRMLRRLLELDRPYASFEGAQLQLEVERNYRWNLTVSILELALFWFGLSFIASSTILPLFFSKLTESTLVFGLVAMLSQGGWYLPQLFTANGVERVPRMLPIMVNVGFFAERLPLFLLVLAAALAARAPTSALVLALVAYAWHVLGAGSIAPAWQELVGRCFPVQRRGRFMGIGGFVGTTTGALGALASTALLTSLKYPANFVAVFALGALSILLSLGFMALVREPVPVVQAPRQSARDFWSNLPDVVRSEANFRWYLLGRVTLAFGAMGLGFVTLSALRLWQVSDGTVGMYTAVSLVGQALGTLSLGLLADRRGHLLSVEITAVAYLLAFALTAWSPAPEAYYLAFLLIGFAIGGQIVSGLLLTLEFAPAGRQPTYAGIVNSSLGVAGILAPLIGAWLASRGFVALFLLAAVFNLAALFILRTRVRDPRHAPGADGAVPTP